MGRRRSGKWRDVLFHAARLKQIAMNEKSILLVEDNPDEVNLARRAFAEGKFANRMNVVHDGVAALEFLLATGTETKRLPAVILLDLNLPRMGGMELLKRVRAHERLKQLPIVVLTSSQEEGDMLRCYELGANSYIRKPVDFDRFTEVVRLMVLYWLSLNEQPPHK